MLNVWKRAVDCRPQYYLCHPIRFFKDISYGLKWSWQRITKGYAAIDWFSMNDYLSVLLPNMLNEFADKAWGYPGETNGFTDESWIGYLREMAVHFSNSQEEQTVQKNAWEELYLEHCCGFQEKNTSTDITMTKDELQDLFFKREEEILEWRKQEVKKALGMMGDIWMMLWD